MSEGKLFIVSGPSGVGKGTICSAILKSSENMAFSVSMTTRSKREGEIEGISYYFVRKDEFLKKISEDSLLEYAEVFGQFYGTPREPIVRKLEAGTDIILDIDVQGAIQVKQKYPESISIFILPPSLDELKRRITNRGTENEEAINLRLGKALNEMSHMNKYDYCVVNDEIDAAVERVKSIVSAEHLRINEESLKIIERFREEL